MISLILFLVDVHLTLGLGASEGCGSRLLYDVHPLYGQMCYNGRKQYEGEDVDVPDEAFCYRFKTECCTLNWCTNLYNFLLFALKPILSVNQIVNCGL